MRWMLCLLLFGCPGPTAPADGSSDGDAGTDAGLDVPGSTATVGVRSETRFEGEPVGSLDDGRHRIDAIRVELNELEWRGDVSEGVHVEIGQEVDFLDGSSLSMQLPPGRYSSLELELDRLEMLVDGASVIETEPFSVRERCAAALDLGVGEERTVRLELDGETLLDELATRLEEDPASEAIRESFKEAVRLRCE